MIDMTIVFTSNNSESVRERIGGNQIVYVASATYADGTEGNFTYDLTAQSSSDLSINISTGEVTLAVNPDYESVPSYTFTVTVTDGVSTTSQSVGLSILDVIEGTGAGETLTMKREPIQ